MFHQFYGPKASPKYRKEHLNDYKLLETGNLYDIFSSFLWSKQICNKPNYDLSNQWNVYSIMLFSIIDIHFITFYLVIFLSNFISRIVGYIVFFLLQINSNLSNFCGTSSLGAKFMAPFFTNLRKNSLFR